MSEADVLVAQATAGKAFSPLAGDGSADPEAPGATRIRRRRRVPVVVLVAAAWLGVVVLLAVLAPLLPVKDPDAVVMDSVVRPSIRHLSQPLGSDELGRSELSRVLFGARVTLTVGVGGTVLAMCFGLLVGVAAGYFRGRVDAVIDILTTTMLAFPPLVLLLGLASVLTPSIGSLTLALALLALPQFVRVARANTMTFVNREFVQASRAMGASHARVIFRDLLPLVLLPVLTFALLVMATLIVAEGALSFLGLGVPPPQSSWGTMVASGRQQLAFAPHLVFVPAFFFFTTVAALNVVGDWARGRAGRQVAL